MTPLKYWNNKKDTCELCRKGLVLLKAIRICLRDSLRSAYATTVLAYARHFVWFALTRSLRLQAFAPPPQCQLTRSNIVKQNAILVLSIVWVQLPSRQALTLSFSCGAASKLQWHAICSVSGGDAKCLRTLPAQCIGCGHEHQNQSKSNNYQSAPLPITNHIDWTHTSHTQHTSHTSPTQYAWHT